MDKVVILENNGGRLANQLWQFASIYSYCLEKKIVCENYVFFRYNKYFNFKILNRFVNLFFFDFYNWHNNIKLNKILYIIFVKIFKFINKNYVIETHGKECFLPPSYTDNKTFESLFNKMTAKSGKVLYFCGWEFENPIGLKKYHQEIKNLFTPKAEYLNTPSSLIANLKSKYKLVVGVHIRQGDYSTWNGGKFYFTCAEVRVILDDFLCHYHNNDVVFVLCSDENIEDNVFFGLNYVKGPGSEIEDLYTLSKTDLIIGSNSTYGLWAAYYGEIPFVVFSKDKMNWSNLTNN